MSVILNITLTQVPVVQSWIRANPELKLTRCFSLGTFVHLLISKFWKIKLLLIQTWILENYLHVSKQAVGKIALKFALT
jgi:hypothetical protein